jgi:pimeloyl-ACP methyl ester carboxylesterase
VTSLHEAAEDFPAQKRIADRGGTRMTHLARAIRVAAAGLAAVAGARYWRDLKRDLARLDAFEPAVIETPYGRVEYAQAGDGPPVLVVHGVFGGYDFGVGVGRVNVPADHRIISPSRFGFFGSPLPADPSPAAQAHAFAALLDHLEITELPVVAFSAGSSSAVQLALRHPERVSRLVLISPNAPHPEPLSKPPRPLAPILFSQPVFWAMRLLARSRLEGMSGTPAGFVPDEREHAALREITDSLFPVGPRARGTIYDGYVGNADIAGYPFESLTVPTLVVAAEDDTLAPYKDSRAMAERIPGARFVSVHRGGHTLTQLDAGAQRAVAAFIDAAEQSAPETPALSQGG